MGRAGGGGEGSGGWAEGGRVGGVARGGCGASSASAGRSAGGRDASRTFGAPACAPAGAGAARQPDRGGSGVNRGAERGRVGDVLDVEAAEALGVPHSCTRGALPSRLYPSLFTIVAGNKKRSPGAPPPPTTFSHPG